MQFKTELSTSGSNDFTIIYENRVNNKKLL